MVPDELRPRWRDLAVLGWLATRRLGSRLVRVPVLGPVACAATWPVTMTTLIGHHADRTLAVRGRVAMVAVQAREPARRSWRRGFASGAAAAVAAAGLCVLPVAAFVVAVVAGTAGWHRVAGVLFGAGVLLAVAEVALIAVSVAPAVRSIAPRQRRAARALARRRGVPLVEAHSLAADDRDSRAATVLVRQLLRSVDAQRMAVIAVPRNAAVATMYRRLGFEPVGPGRDRMLVRWSPR